MAIRIYALESMIYRIGGDNRSSRLNSRRDRRADKTKQAMQVLEEYAIESSISKVVRQRNAGLCAWMKRVQIFGGYGFHEDYPVARAYRD